MNQESSEDRKSRLLEMLLSKHEGAVVMLTAEDFSAVNEMIKHGWVKKVVKGDPMFRAFFSDGPAFQFGGVVMDGVRTFVSGMENTRMAFEKAVDLELEEIIRRSHHNAPRHLLAVQELARRKAAKDDAEAKEKAAAFEQAERHHEDRKNQFRHSILVSWSGAAIAVVAAVVSYRNSQSTPQTPPQVKPEPPAAPISPTGQKLPSLPTATTEEKSKPQEPKPATEPPK